MNSSSEMAGTGLAFGPILLLLLLFLVPGTILGWVAAGRIRQSEGKLYGMRFAAFAALFVPALFLLLIPVIAVANIIGASVFSSYLSEEDSLLLGIVVFGTLGLLNLKIFQGSFRHVLGKGSFRGAFGLKKNRYVLIFLAILWIALGVVLYLQRPRQIDEDTSVDSPDRMFSATVSTWRRMNVFDSDEFTYRFVVQGQGRSYHEDWEIPVPTAKLATDSINVPPFKFGDSGTIHWSEDGKHVRFHVNGIEVFTTLVSDGH